MSETNTLVVHKLAKAAISAAVARIGQLEIDGLVQLVPLASMRRVLVVFESAARAKRALPDIIAALRATDGCDEALVGFSLNDIDSARTAETAAASHLQLPSRGKLWFVSPPPSPPNEWQESLEEEPNRRTHFETDFDERLVSALAEVANEPISPVTPQDPPARSITIIEANENYPELRVEQS